MIDYIWGVRATDQLRRLNYIFYFLLFLSFFSFFLFFFAFIAVSSCFLCSKDRGETHRHHHRSSTDRNHHRSKPPPILQTTTDPPPIETTTDRNHHRSEERFEPTTDPSPPLSLCLLVFSVTEKGSKHNTDGNPQPRPTISLSLDLSGFLCPSILLYLDSSVDRFIQSSQFNF